MLLMSSINLPHLVAAARREARPDELVPGDGCGWRRHGDGRPWRRLRALCAEMARVVRKRNLKSQQCRISPKAMKHNENEINAWRRVAMARPASRMS